MSNREVLLQIVAIIIAMIIFVMLKGCERLIKALESCLQRMEQVPETGETTYEKLQPSVERRYQIRFFHDWGCDSPFWCGNDAARAKFDVGPIQPEALGLSAQTSEQVYALAEWNNTGLNWDHPPDPGPWRQEECDRFNAAVDALLEVVRAELGEEYEILDEEHRASEDPDLDRYLADPKGFQRR